MLKFLKAALLSSLFVFALRASIPEVPHYRHGVKFCATKIAAFPFGPRIKRMLVESRNGTVFARKLGRELIAKKFNINLALQNLYLGLDEAFPPIDDLDVVVVIGGGLLDEGFASPDVELSVLAYLRKIFHKDPRESQRRLEIVLRIIEDRYPGLAVELLIELVEEVYELHDALRLEWGKTLAP